MSKIKAALCYSGAVRGLINNLEHLQNVLFSKGDYDIDYYLYADFGGGTISKKDIESGKNEPQGLKVKNELPFFNCMLVNEMDGFDERFDKFTKNIVNYHMPYEQQVHQWYNVKKVFDYVFSHDKQYDVYFRVRCDIFPAGLMDFDWSNFDENSVYVPFNGPFGGINDRFAFGSKKAMSIYSNFYDSKIYYDTYDLNPETIQKGIDFYQKFYGHIPSVNYGSGGHNSEVRMLNHLHDQGLSVQVLPPHNLHISAVRDSDGLIRYGGPDLEDMLVSFNGFQKQDLKYDRIWWR